MLPLLALLLAPAPANAREIVVGAAAGRDFPTDQFWTGVEFAWYPDQERKWAPLVRVTPAWGFADAFPHLGLEAGVQHAVSSPDKPFTVRLGLIASTLVVATEYRLPLELAEGDRHWGFVPGIEATVEFEFGEQRAFVFGVRGGIRSASSNYLCDQPDDVEDCLAWFPGFTGGFFGRGRLTDWLYLEGLVGPSPRISLGYPF